MEDLIRYAICIFIGAGCGSAFICIIHRFWVEMRLTTLEFKVSDLDTQLRLMKELEIKYIKGDIKTLQQNLMECDQKLYKDMLFDPYDEAMYVDEENDED